MDASSVLTWLRANWYVALVATLYVIANVAPRPHPEDMVGWKKALWETVDRLCLLTAGDVPGKLKGIFAPTPVAFSKSAKAAVAAAKTKDEGDS